LEALVLTNIIRSCLEGNESARRALYAKYAPSIMGLCFRYSNCKADAEEILQESFIKAFQNLHRLNDPERFEWWLKRIAVNSAITFYKKNRRLIHRRDVEHFENMLTDSFSIDKKLELDEVLTIIQRLPEKMRLVINLYAIDGYTHEEISTMLKISIGTSKSNLFDARKRLVKELGKTEENSK